MGFLKLDGGSEDTRELERLAVRRHGDRTIVVGRSAEVRVNTDPPPPMGVSLADGDLVEVESEGRGRTRLVHYRAEHEWPRITARLAPVLRRTLPDRAARILDVLDRWHVLSNALSARPEPNDAVVSCSICATGRPRQKFSALVYPEMEWVPLREGARTGIWAVLCDVCAQIGATTFHSDVGAALADCRRALDHAGEPGAALERFATRCLPANCSICGAGQASRLYEQNWLAFCRGCFRDAAEVPGDRVDFTPGFWSHFQSLVAKAADDAALMVRWRALRRRTPMPEGVARAFAAHLVERLPASRDVAEELLAREPEGVVARILGEVLPPPGL